MPHPAVDLFHQSGEVIRLRNPLGSAAFPKTAVVDQLDREPTDRLGLLEHLRLQLTSHLPSRASASSGIESKDQSYWRQTGVSPGCWRDTHQFRYDCQQRSVEFLERSVP